MTHPHHAPASAQAKAAPSPFVEVTVVFRDLLQKPIEGLSVVVEAGSDAPRAPQWKLGKDSDDPPAANPASAQGAASTSAPDASAPMVNNHAEVVTDADGYAVTIRNAARNQPLAVWVKNRRGKYVWKANLTPKKDISAFTITSPEYHLEATTMLTPKEAFEQELDLPVVKEGEVMTIERLVKDFGPYIGWSQKITEQGEVRKDFPTRGKEVAEDETTHEKKTKITIEHQYKVVDTGKPRTIVLNVLGSRLNYPKAETLTDAQIESIASELKCEPAAVSAIVRQEASGVAYLGNGLPKIRYERHFFFRLLLPEKKQANYKKEKNPYPQYPDICFPVPGGYGPEGMHQYERLISAAAINLEVALKSCSWGLFQIMGEYFKSCGCSSVAEMANKSMMGADEQRELFVSFLCNEKHGVLKGLQDKDWEKVAAGYNGKDWRKSNPDYAKKLQAFYDEYR